MKELTLEEVIALGEQAIEIQWFNLSETLAQRVLDAAGITEPLLKWEYTGEFESDDQGGGGIRIYGLYVHTENHRTSWNDEIQEPNENRPPPPPDHRTYDHYLFEHVYNLPHPDAPMVFSYERRPAPLPKVYVDEPVQAG